MHKKLLIIQEFFGTFLKNHNNKKVPNGTLLHINLNIGYGGAYEIQTHDLLLAKQAL